MEHTERIRVSAPSPRGDLTPFLSPQAAGLHAQLICGKLAAELNLLLDGFPALQLPDAEAIAARVGLLPRLLREDVSFAAGGIVCHSYFFRYLTENGGTGTPDEACAAAFRGAFGSTDSFFYIFREEAQRMQSGGFLWLCISRGSRGNTLRLLPTGGYTLPPASLAPVFALDLWEHAYLNTYETDRRAYADAFLRQLDWEAVGKRITGK